VTKFAVVLLVVAVVAANERISASELIAGRYEAVIDVSPSGPQDINKRCLYRMNSKKQLIGPAYGDIPDRLCRPRQAMLGPRISKICPNRSLLAGVAEKYSAQIERHKSPSFACHRPSCNQRVGRPMTTLQAFFFGMMIAWTPSLALLAWYLRHPPEAEE
jgi:hypothetical protein